MKEIWKECKEQPIWLISNKGRVFSNYCNRCLKLQLVGASNNQKYYSVAINISGNIKHLKVHRLVAGAFIPNPDNKPHVNHKDGNKLNNSVKNLEWATVKENCVHAVETGLNKKRGQYNQNSKIKDKEIPHIKALYKIGFKQKQISAMYNVNQSAISRIVNNINYKKLY